MKQRSGRCAATAVSAHRSLRSRVPIRQGRTPWDDIRFVSRCSARRRESVSWLQREGSVMTRLDGKAVRRNSDSGDTAGACERFGGGLRDSEDARTRPRVSSRPAVAPLARHPVAGSTFPGLRMPCGSSADFNVRIRAISSGEREHAR